MTICTTGFLLGIFSTIVVLLIAAPLLVRWMMKRKSNALMEDVGSKVADFIGPQTELNNEEEIINGIETNSEEEEEESRSD